MKRIKMKRIKLELEFIPCSEAMPEESGEYLCVNSNSKNIGEYCYSARHKAFNVRDRDDTGAFSLNKDITHWAKLPDLNKVSEIQRLETAYEEAKIKSFGFHIASNHKVETALDQQRRRDLFERVALRTIAIDDGEPSWMPEAAKKIAEVILATADKFARGEK
jgi:hypothetical protein